MNSYQQCWWEQAQSDHDILILLRRQNAEPCHQLHYLQMVTEKLSKAYFWRTGAPLKKSHKCFGAFMRALQSESGDKRRKRIANILGFPRFKDFRNWTNTALPLVYEIEKLAPALANDGPNPEYPWPLNAPQYLPATYDFEIWRDLINTGLGRQLMQVIDAAVEKFPNYA